MSSLAPLKLNLRHYSKEISIKQNSLHERRTKVICVTYGSGVKKYSIEAKNKKMLISAANSSFTDNLLLERDYMNQITDCEH